MRECHASSRGGAQLLLFWMFGSGFGGWCWRETFAEVPRAATAASAVPANKRDRTRWVLRERWLLWRAEPRCPGLAGACPWDKGRGRFWVLFLLKLPLSAERA